MKRSRALLLLLVLSSFFLLLSPSLLPAQQLPDSLSAKYTQELETRTLRITGAIRPVEGLWTVRSLSHAEITLRELPGYESQWKADLGLDLSAERGFTSSGFGLLFEVRGQDYQDREAARLRELGAATLYPGSFTVGTGGSVPVTGQNSRIGRASARGGVSWKRENVAELYLLGGRSWDNQLEGSGDGPSARAGLIVTGRKGEFPEIRGDGWIDRFNDRQNHNAALEGKYDLQIGDAENRLSAVWRNNRTDLFLGGNGGVVRRVQEGLNINNRLTVPVVDGIDGVHTLTIRRSGVTYRGGGPGESAEMDVDNRLALRMRRGSFDSELFFTFLSEDRDYGGSLILGRHSSAGLEVVHFHGADSLSLRLTTRKLRFDSPDRAELSDRDRLIHNVTLRGMLELTPELAATLDLSALLDHLVYINAERSADNRWNRVFRFNPGIDWRPGAKVHNLVEFEVLANYTSYDFDTPSSSPDVRSTAFRRWSATDTLRLPLGGEWGGEISLRYDLEDRGRFAWKDFFEDVSDEWTSEYVTVAIERDLWRRLDLKLGYHLEKRIEDRIERDLLGETKRTRARTYRAEGPTFRLRWRNSTRFHGSASGNLLKIDDSSRDNTYRLDSFQVSMAILW